MAEDTLKQQLEALSSPAGGGRASELLTGKPPPGVAVPSTGAAEGAINPVTGMPETVEALSEAGEPTVGEKATEVGYGLLEGVSRTAPSVTGGMVGFRAGTGLAPLMGPYAPLGIAGATVAGVGIGALIGNEFDIRYPGVARQDLVPYREGGKTWGDTIALAPIAFNIPVTQAQRVSEAIRILEPTAAKFGMEGAARASRFLTDVTAAMGRTAQAYPKSFLAAEAISGAGAGVGGGMAEAYAPGEPGTRLASEIVGGVLAPSRLFIHMGSAKDLMGNIAASFSKDARQSRAANKLRSILEDAGEDVDKVIRSLEANVPRGAQPTAGQKTGVRALSILENTLARENAKYGGEIADQGLKTLQAYTLLAKNLEQVGSPQALRAAAQLREEAFNAMLENRQSVALLNAAQKIQRISKDTPEARQQIGEIVRQATQDALSDARGHERTLWTRAVADLSRPTTQTVTERVQVGKMVDEAGRPLMRTREVTRVTLPSVVPTNTVRDFLNETLTIADSVYKGTVPPLVKKVMGQMGVTEADVARYKLGRQTEEFANTGIVPDRFLPKGRDVQLGELVNMRSNLLDLARDAAVKGENADARFFGNIANSMMKDLDQVKSPALDEARSFSRTLNDYFTRSFAGEMLSKKGTGALAYPPEVLVQRAFGANNDLAAMRMADIEDAVGMLRKEYTDAVARFGRDSAEALSLKPLADLSSSRVVSIRDAQQRILRLAAAETIDPNTGRVSATRLSRFIEKRRPLLDRLQITDDLSDAVKAENAFKATASANSVLDKSLRNQTAFAQVLKRESPSMAIADALNSKFPVRSLSNIVKLAKAGGPDAAAGLKSSLYDYAFTKAGGDRGFNAQAFKDAFFSPIAQGQPSIYNILRSQGVMTLSEGKNLRRIIDPMIRVEQSLGDRQLMEGVMQGADAATELALRVVGSRIGTSVSGSGPGSLIAASAGSKYMRQIFDKSPMLLVRGIIEEATKDPQMMALLLRRGQSEGEKLMLARQMHAYLTAAGLNYERFTEPGPEPTVQAPQPVRSFAPRRQPATASTRGVPGLNIGGGGPPQLGGGAPAAGGGSSREMLQRLFPFDATLR
jgi:hypothetical protein